ncbi:MAG TPA: hypothetical protein VFL69_06925 [Marmoricola sp.]|nr:hypothetical protein [Marmoricola sp.]
MQGRGAGEPASTGRLSERTRTLCALVSVAVLATAAPTLLVHDILNGPAVMNGSARGTALTMLVLALPTLWCGLLIAGRDPVRGRALVVGALAYVVYNATLFVFATPFNSLFLLDVALLGLALWTLVSSLVDPLPRLQPGPALPVRTIVVFILAVVALNATAWLMFVIPDLAQDPPGFLDGTGLTTNPIYVQDLAVWLPALTIAAVLLWRRHPVGVVLAGSGLVFWLVEAIGVAVDQWFGHQADPASDVATLAGAVMFVVLAAATAVPLAWWWRTATRDLQTRPSDWACPYCRDRAQRHRAGHVVPK